MVRDPKQFLLLHVEKIVLVAMALLLILVFIAYHPLGIEVPEKAEIERLLEEGMVAVGVRNWDKLPVVQNHVAQIAQIIDTPWQDGAAPSLRPLNELDFDNTKGGVTDDPHRFVPPPVVIPASKAYARALKGKAVVIFQIDHRKERRELDSLAVPDYQSGIPFERIEIYRIDRSTGEKTRATPESGWLPEGLPRQYGAPPGFPGGAMGPAYAPGFAEPIYVFAQERSEEEEMRRRMAEERAREEELRKRIEDERRRHERTPTRPSRPGSPTRPRPAPGDTDETTIPAGWHYFLDSEMTPDVEYDYQIILVCRNPAKQPGSTQPARVASAPTTGRLNEPVPSFRQWYFTGGSVTNDVELGNFKVRCYMGGQQEITSAEISRLIAELTGTAEVAAPPTRRRPGEVPVAEGAWVEKSFTVRPGEEIGMKVSVSVDGEKRAVDFRTGCQLVSIREDVQVIEDQRTARVPEGGTVVSEKRVQLIVFSKKLRIAYVDAKGRLHTRWQEMPPAIASAGMGTP